ncbi:MAG: hypothetical protein KDD56_00430 [Bdellovibrionales bacterium]|nr:hypothetical protein [Bdellovibrionales bacterium]
MKLEGLAYANTATQGRSVGREGAIPEIKSGIQATYTAAKSGGLFAREMTLQSNEDRVEVKIETDKPNVTKDPFDSIASELFANGNQVEKIAVALDIQKVKAVEAYTHESEA